MNLTIDFLARQLKLPATCQKDYLRIRSRIFRFSYVKYTNSAFWNSKSRSYDIVNFGFFNIAALSRITESRRPVTFHLDQTFMRLIEQSPSLAFDYDLYRTLSPAMRRFYLIANRDGWNQRDSSIFIADDFAIHQIGYSEKPTLHKLRMQRLRGLLREAEEREFMTVFAMERVLPTHDGRSDERPSRAPMEPGTGAQDQGNIGRQNLHGSDRERRALRSGQGIA